MHGGGAGSYGGTRPKDNNFYGRNGHHLGGRNGRDRLLSLSEKRKIEDAEQAGGTGAATGDGGDGYQNQNNGNRRNRKVNYGKCNVEVAGGEAAPYEVFVGNTNPGSSPEIIGDVLKKCAEMLPPDQQLSEPLQVLQVKCMTRPNESGEPLRTKCWMVQVPNKYREHMLKDDAYPYGWSHRRYFPKGPRNHRILFHHLTQMLLRGLICL